VPRGDRRQREVLSRVRREVGHAGRDLVHQPGRRRPGPDVHSEVDEPVADLQITVMLQVKAIRHPRRLTPTPFG
jgi:hypothetical protein